MSGFILGVKRATYSAATLVLCLALVKEAQRPGKLADAVPAVPVSNTGGHDSWVYTSRYMRINDYLFHGKEAPTAIAAQVSQAIFSVA